MCQDGRLDYRSLTWLSLGQGVMEDQTAYYQMDLGGFMHDFIVIATLGDDTTCWPIIIHKLFVVQPLVPPKFLQTSTASVPTVAEFPKLRTLELGKHPLWLIIQPMQCGLKFRAAMQNISFYIIFDLTYILHSLHCPFPKPAILGIVFAFASLLHAVDGRNPAPLHTENLPLFTGSCVSQVVIAGFLNHQPYPSHSTISKCPQSNSHTIHVWYIIFTGVKFEPLNHQKQTQGLKFDTLGGSRYLHLVDFDGECKYSNPMGCDI